MKTLRLTNTSIRCIEEALTDKINAFPDTNKGYNQSREYRKALKKIRNGEFNRQDRHTSYPTRKACLT